MFYQEYPSILFNNSIPRNQWTEFIANNPYASPFQTPEFFDLYNSIPNLSSVAIAVVYLNSIKALAVISLQKEPGIKSYFSRRAIIYGGPLFINDEYISLEILLKEIKSYLKRRVIYLEIRNFFDYKNYKKTFNRLGYKYIPWLNFHVKPTNSEGALSSMSKSRKRQINKAIKQGVLWREAQSITEVEKFYIILQDLYRDRVKKPLFPFEFFKEFFEKDLGKYLFVYYKGEIIAGIMCPVISKKAIYEYYVCGLDSEYKELYPSVMATWAAIEYAIQNGIPLLDFMGAGPPDKEYGVREFKARFGGESVEYGRFLLRFNPLFYSLGKLGLKIISKFKI